MVTQNFESVSREEVESELTFLGILLFENKLITGDTLFVNAIGRTDLPGGDAPALFDSLQKLKKLDEKIEVYPGHDYGDIPVSTIGREKKNNPYLMCKSKEEFLRMVGY